MDQMGSSYDIQPCIRHGSKSFSNDNGNRWKRVILGKFFTERENKHNSLEEKIYIFMTL